MAVLWGTHICVRCLILWSQNLVPVMIFRRRNLNQDCIGGDVLIWHLAPKSVVLNVHKSVFSFSIWVMDWSLFRVFLSLAMKLWPYARDVDAAVSSDAVRCKHKVLYSVQEYQEIKWRAAWQTQSRQPQKTPPCACRAAKTHARATLSSDTVDFCHRNLMHWDSWLRHGIVQPLGGTADPLREPQMVNTRGPLMKCVPCCLCNTRSIGRPQQPTRWRDWHCSCCQAAALIAHTVSSCSGCSVTVCVTALQHIISITLLL
jgi:hypothetical protein